MLTTGLRYRTHICSFVVSHHCFVRAVALIIIIIWLMELITSGLELFPERLTPKAIYCLSFHEYEKIQDTLFTVQVVSVKSMGSNERAEQPIFDCLEDEATGVLSQVAALKSQQMNAVQRSQNSGC